MTKTPAASLLCSLLLVRANATEMLQDCYNLHPPSKNPTTQGDWLYLWCVLWAQLVLHHEGLSLNPAAVLRQRPALTHTPDKRQ